MVEPLWEDTVRCFSLIFLGLLFLPISILVACVCLLVLEIAPYLQPCAQAQHENPNEATERTILVTGVGMAKGLTLARSFYLSGHRVIGADFETLSTPCSGRFSRSLSAFYRLPKPNTNEGGKSYIECLTQIISTEKVDLWVSCSGVANAVEDAQAKEIIEQDTRCKCIQFDVQSTSTLHEKGSFVDECKRVGLPVPETHEVKSQSDVLRILSKAKSKQKFILKPVGVDDRNRGNMTLLPLPSDTKTKEHVSQLPISKSNPWILQQFIPGGEEYCTHALVVRGEVKCFVACPSAELLMHYEALPPDSALWKSMLAFTIEFVQNSPRPEAMTGHLSFDFMASEGTPSQNGFAKNIYAIECNPRAHTAVVLFSRRGPEMEAMVRAYLSTLEMDQNGTANGVGSTGHLRSSLVMPPRNSRPRYWLGHDLVSLFLHPILKWIQGLDDFGHGRAVALEFWTHLLFWKEGTFEVWDPFPAFCLYHVVWPMTIFSAWWKNQQWSRINVSTTKMFAC
ncbi:hypothetical protein F4818DRAFT_154491 [Hypoxylon cercidicola]|nr:hypothetical protein F4818DRAFT_154491 [Hypoxylon cercidicola]